LLSQIGRPKSFKSKSSRTVIQTHHRLHKQLAAANAAGNAAEVSRISQLIEDNGGLELYQQASLTGQRNDRGGDSSKVLVDWIGPIIASAKKRDVDGQGDADAKLRLLEVGALHPSNAITKLKCIKATRIDLNSQHPSIESQDFMERPLPSNNSDAFDIVSLSLVLNYVPDAKGRGAMLRRCAQFLRSPAASIDNQSGLLPALFLVLPLPCVQNSRYLTWDHLITIMSSLGFECRHQKETNKLSYSLWTLVSRPIAKKEFKKTELNPGHGRNNFCVILE